MIYRNPRVVLRTPATLPQPFEPVAITRQRVPGPVLKTFPLRDILPASEIARLQFGVSVDGTPVGPNDFAATGPLKLELNVDHEGYLAELHTDVELGAEPRRGDPRDAERPAGRPVARRRPARLHRRPGERRLQDVPRRHRRVRRADAAQLARRGEPGRQGSGAARRSTTPTTAPSTTPSSSR